MFLQFLVDILSLGSGSVDPYIFADPDLDPGSQNLADPRNLMFLTIFLCVQCTLNIAKEKFRDLFMNVLVLIVFCFTESRIITNEVFKL